MKLVLILGIAVSSFLSVAKADLDPSGNFLTNTPIRAADLNAKINQIKTAINNNADFKRYVDPDELVEVEVGAPISKLAVLQNLYKLTPLYSAGDLSTMLGVLRLMEVRYLPRSKII